MSASTATRPDIAAAVGVLSQYMSKLSKDHWMGVNRRRETRIIWLH